MNIPLRILNGKSWVIMLVLLVFLGLSVSPVTAFDQLFRSVDAQMLSPAPISTLGVDQFSPRIAYAGQIDQYLAVWEHVVQEDNIDIYSRRVDNQGTPIGNEVTITAAASMDIHPEVGYSPALDEYLVVWENEYSYSDHDILARRMTASNGSMGPEIRVAYSGQYDMQPVVTYHPVTHEYLIVFERRVDMGGYYQQDLIGQLMNEDGTLYPWDFVIANSALDEQAASVSCDGTNFLVVWQGTYNSQTNIYGQLLASDGSFIGNQIGISTWNGNQLAPRLAFNGNDGHYFVVWEDHHFTPSEIYGLRVDWGGNPVGSQVSVAVGGTKNRAAPDVIFNQETLSYLVAWELEYSPSDHDIYSRRVAHDASLPDPEIAITALGSEEMHPRLVTNVWNAALVVWDDWRNVGYTGVDIYGSLETINIPKISGVVYEGDVGDTSDPLTGSLMQLGCSNTYGDFGELQWQIMTNEQGQYQLPAFTYCEYYNILEIDPVGYYSIGAQSTGGAVLNSNWIYYTPPLLGKVLSGNLFWDKPEGAGDTTPPGNWNNFQPTDWVNVQTVPVSEQVEDTQSGLNTNTAEFQYSIDGGASWSGWMPASITGDPGTTDPQEISADVPFGQDSGPVSLNKVQFRVADMEGNLGDGPVHAVKIDSVLPLNPTSISSPTHTPNVWSNNQYITVQWSGASDERSGIFGYSTTFDNSPSTIPDVYRDTEDPSQVNYAYIDSSGWWFHVRALDVAGNAAQSAVHMGPFCIDTVAPTAWMITQGGLVNQLTVFIEWDGFDGMAGIESYEVQTNINGGGWNGWVNTITKGNYFTGNRGDEVGFRVRSYDEANNVSEWSSPITLLFGVDVTVRVKNESGAPIQDAKVYHLNNFIGLTDIDGTITVPNVMLGDPLSALALEMPYPAGKPDHEKDGVFSWSWRVYLTTIRIADDGTPVLFYVTDPDVVQTLTVRKDQALIGAHIIAVVQWDADSAFLEELRQGLVSASSYLYDVTNGQFFFETIEIFDNNENRPANDMIFYTDNTVWPNAFVGAISAYTYRMMFPPVFKGPWSGRVAYGTFIHEFGHYGLYLFDEYKIRDGSGGGFCTFNWWTVPEPTRASIMNNSDDTSELCSRADPYHLHNPNTEQDKQNNGETTWETVMRKYSDWYNPPRWILHSPDTRSLAVIPGPNSLPIMDWVKVYVDDNNTNVCQPFLITAVYPDGSPVVGGEFTVQAQDSSLLYQGKTEKQGKIIIRGAHNGDTLIGKLGDSSQFSIINCSPQKMPQSAPVVQEPVVFQPDPFILYVNTIPVSDISVQVQVDSSVVLPDPPQASLWQDGSTLPIEVPLVYDSGLGLYIGLANLDPTLDLKGFTHVSATDAQNNTLFRVTAFTIQMINPEGTTFLKSSDGLMEINLPAGSIPGNPAVSILPDTQVILQQGKLAVIGNPYKVTTSSGELMLDQTAILNIYYSDSYQTISQDEAFGIYQWDDINEKWVLISMNRSSEHNLISAQVTELGTFAILGSPLYLIQLPLISR